MVKCLLVAITQIMLTIKHFSMHVNNILLTIFWKFLIKLKSVIIEFPLCLIRFRISYLIRISSAVAGERVSPHSSINRNPRIYGQFLLKIHISIKFNPFAITQHSDHDQLPRSATSASTLDETSTANGPQLHVRPHFRVIPTIWMCAKCAIIYLI